MKNNINISKSKIIILVFATAIVCIFATAYASNYYHQKEFAQTVFTFNIFESQHNIWLARKLRNGETEKIIKFLDASTGSNAIIFTDYKKYAPNNLHQDIAETLTMIKNYREEFKVESTVADQQKDIDKSLAQIK
jgi:hypothetical protein